MGELGTAEMGEKWAFVTLTLFIDGQYMLEVVRKIALNRELWMNNMNLHLLGMTDDRSAENGTGAL